MRRGLLLLPGAARSCARTLRGRNTRRGAGAGTLLVLAIAAAGGLVPLLVRAHEQFRAGQLPAAALAWDLALAQVAVFWLVIPVFASTLSGETLGFPARALVTLPLGTSDSLVLGAAIQILHPACVGMAAMTCAAALPALSAPSPVAGAIAAAVFGTACALWGWAASLWSAIVLRRRAQRALASGAVVLAAAALLLAVGIARPQWRDGGLWLVGPAPPVLLQDATGTHRTLAAIRRAWPPSRVGDLARGAPVQAMVPLLALAAGGVVAVLGGLRFAPASAPMGARPRRSRPIGVFPGLAAGAGAGTAKELRDQARTVDGVVGFLTGAGLAAVIAVSDDPAPLYLAAAVPVALLVQSSACFNAFGLDGDALQRWRLLPLRGTDIVRAKCVALLVLLALQTLPVWIVSGWRFGTTALAAALPWAVAGALLSTGAGALTSVRAPVPRSGLGLDDFEQSGGFLGLLVFLVAWAAAASVWSLGATRSPWARAGIQLAFAAVALAVYRQATAHAGRRFEFPPAPRLSSRVTS